MTLDTPAPREVPWATVDDALAAAREKRPELKAAREQALAAKATSTAAKLAWVPNVDGRFTQMWTENTGFNGENWNWMAVASATWVPWDGGFRVAEQARAASQQGLAGGRHALWHPHVGHQRQGKHAAPPRAGAIDAGRKVPPRAPAARASARGGKDGASASAVLVVARG